LENDRQSALKIGFCWFYAGKMLANCWETYFLLDLFAFCWNLLDKLSFNIVQATAMGRSGLGLGKIMQKTMVFAMTSGY